jgi:hypothetical protein
MSDVVIKDKNIDNNLFKSHCRDKNCNENKNFFGADNLRVINWYLLHHSLSTKVLNP